MTAVLILVVFMAQSALIVCLLLQHARRRRAEEASRLAEAKYRSVVETQSELICRFLPDTTLTFVNDAYCRFWNKTEAELLGRQFINLIPKNAHPVVLERLQRLTSGQDSQDHEVLLSDGTIGWQHWVNRAIVDSQGRLTEIQGVGRDITDRKRAEEALGRLEARHGAILRALPDLIVVVRRDGTCVDYSARNRSLLFAPPETSLGSKLAEILPPRPAAKLMAAIERACVSSEPVLVEYELLMPERRSHEARLVHVEQDRVLIIVRDITKAKRTHRRNRDLAGRLITSQEVERTRIARELHDSVCQEVAAVSVEVSYLRQNRGDIQSSDVQERLVALQRHTATVAEHVRLLSHGLHSSVLHHIGLLSALHSHCAEFERQYRLRVRFFAPERVEPVSQPVALALFRIAQEALANAARHGGAKQATVSLERTATSVVLTVADDGKGFDVHAARQNGGLGLVSMEERARFVRGRVAIRSRPGSGTTVDVRIPVQIADDQLVAQAGDAHVARRKSTRFVAES